MLNRRWLQEVETYHGVAAATGARKLIEARMRLRELDASYSPTAHTKKIRDFFKGNPHPDEDEIKELSDSLDISVKDLTNEIYELFSIFSNVGKHQDMLDSEFDVNELAKGIEIEKEHTDNTEVAREIAKDHLSEISNYYTRLIAMEKDYEKE